MELRHLRDDLPLEVRIERVKGQREYWGNVARQRARRLSEALRRERDSEIVLAILEGQKRELTKELEK